MHVEEQEVRPRRHRVVIGFLYGRDCFLAVPRHVENVIKVLIAKGNTDNPDISQRVLGQQNLVWTRFGSHDCPLLTLAS